LSAPVAGCQFLWLGFTPMSAHSPIAYRREARGAVLLLVVVALIATLVPVRRALRIDPIDALRTD